jgi:hypothetical protein
MRAPRCNVPRSLSQYAAVPRKQWKSWDPQKHLGQCDYSAMVQGFDTALGLCALSGRAINLDRSAANAQSSGQDQSHH